jgi:hypothetical protein
MEQPRKATHLVIEAQTNHLKSHRNFREKTQAETDLTPTGLMQMKVKIHLCISLANSERAMN